MTVRHDTGSSGAWHFCYTKCEARLIAGVLLRQKACLAG